LLCGTAASKAPAVRVAAVVSVKIFVFRELIFPLLTIGTEKS
jgi:hypothetical protein